MRKYIIFYCTNQLTTYFSPQGDFRLGDLLPPYLFILCINVLSCSLLEAKMNSLFKGLSLGGGGHPSVISCLQMTYYSCSKWNTLQLRSNYDRYCKFYGLWINHDKSSLSVSPDVIEEVKRVASTDLGIVIAEGSDISQPAPWFWGKDERFFLPIVNKVPNELQEWKCWFLSQSGKLTLIQLVLQAILIYTQNNIVLAQ